MAPIQISGYTTANQAFNYEIRPSDIQVTIKNFGDDTKAIDGTYHKFHRSYKRSFKLSFNNVLSGVANTLDTIFTTPEQMDFITMDGVKYTVFTEPDSFSSTLSATNVSRKKDAQGQYIRLYTVTFNLVEK